METLKFIALVVVAILAIQMLSGASKSFSLTATATAVVSRLWSLFTAKPASAATLQANAAQTSELKPAIPSVAPYTRHGLIVTQEVADALVANGVEVDECRKLIDPILPKLVVYHAKPVPQAA